MEDKIYISFSRKRYSTHEFLKAKIDDEGQILSLNNLFSGATNCAAPIVARPDKTVSQYKH